MKIVEMNLRLLDNGSWEVAVRKTFAPENGGGEQWVAASSARPSMMDDAFRRV